MQFDENDVRKTRICSVTIVELEMVCTHYVYFRVLSFSWANYADIYFFFVFFLVSSPRRRAALDGP